MEAFAESFLAPPQANDPFLSGANPNTVLPSMEDSMLGFDPMNGQYQIHHNQGFFNPWVNSIFPSTNNPTMLSPQQATCAPHEIFNDVPPMFGPGMQAAGLQASSAQGSLAFSQQNMLANGFDTQFPTAGLVQGTQLGQSIGARGGRGRPPLSEGNMSTAINSNTQTTVSGAFGKENAPPGATTTDNLPWNIDPRLAQAFPSPLEQNAAVSPEQADSQSSASSQGKDENAAPIHEAPPNLLPTHRAGGEGPVAVNEECQSSDSKGTQQSTTVPSPPQSLTPELTDTQSTTSYQENGNGVGTVTCDAMPHSFQSRMTASFAPVLSRKPSFSEEINFIGAMDYCKENGSGVAAVHDAPHNFQPHMTAPSAPVFSQNQYSASFSTPSDQVNGDGATATMGMFDEAFHSYNLLSGPVFVPEQSLSPEPTASHSTTSHKAKGKRAASINGMPHSLHLSMNEPSGLNLSSNHAPSPEHSASHPMRSHQAEGGDESRLPGLHFSNAKEAEEAGLGPQWAPYRPDNTIPQNDTDRQRVVLRLLQALRNREGTQDRMGHVYRSRWAQVDSDNNPIEFYDPRAMEKVCWDILTLAEDLHLHGPGFMPLHDPEFNKIIDKTRTWTFGQRIDTLVEVMHNFKGRCDKLMKGGEVLLYVANPGEVLATSKTNRTQNDKRQVLLGEGRRAVAGKATQASGTGRKPAAPRGRGKRTALANTANVDNGTAPPVDASNLQSSSKTSSDGIEHVALNKNGKRSRVTNAAPENTDDIPNRRVSRRKRARRNPEDSDSYYEA